MTSASPSNFSTGTVTDSSVILNWTAGTDPGGAVAGYTVSVSSDEGQSWNVSTPSGGALGSSATGVTVTGLNPSSIYLFEVTATNAAGSSYAAGPIGAKTPALAEGTPVLSVSQNTTDSRFEPWTSLHLSWTYNGDDAPNFDFQIKDTTLGENFHELGDNYTSSFSEDSGGTSGTVYGLTAGDSYIFRMRQDYADGSVSVWSTTTPAIAPPLATPTPNAVDVSEVTNSSGAEQLVVGWSGLPSGGLVQIEFKSDAYPCDQQDANQGWVILDPNPTADNHYAIDTGATEVVNSDDQGCMINPGVVNNAGSYTYRVRGFVPNGGPWGDSYGQPTAWSPIGSDSAGTLPESIRPMLGVSAVTDHSVTLNWTGSAAANTTSFYSLNWQAYVPGFDSTMHSDSISGQGAGQISGTTTAAVSGPMSSTVTGLLSGVKYVFVLTTHFSDGSPAAYSDAPLPGDPPIVTAGAVVPGPLSSNDGLTASTASGVVELNWTDNTVNEAGFEIQRSADPSFPSNSETTKFTVGADQNSYVDTGAGLDSVYYYRIRAIGDSSGNYDSPYTSSVTVNTPGLNISFGSDPLDPAFNPEIWVDNSAMNYSTGTIDPPTSTSDSNLVPVTFNVPLGADTVGTA